MSETTQVIVAGTIAVLLFLAVLELQSIVSYLRAIKIDLAEIRRRR